MAIDCFAHSSDTPNRSCLKRNKALEINNEGYFYCKLIRNKLWLYSRFQKCVLHTTYFNSLMISVGEFKFLTFLT